MAQSRNIHVEKKRNYIEQKIEGKNSLLDEESMVFQPNAVI